MGLTMSDGRSMRVDECDGTGITSLIEQSNTPNRSNVVGSVVLPNVLPFPLICHQESLRSPLYSVEPHFYIVILTGFERNWGIPKIS